jgi:hypothetical protein
MQLTRWEVLRLWEAESEVDPEVAILETGGWRLKVDRKANVTIVRLLGFVCDWEKYIPICMC